MLSVGEKTDIEGREGTRLPGAGRVDGGFKQMDEMLAKNPSISAVFCENNSNVPGRAESDQGRPPD